jgi:superfamily II DNA or RNA helicase
MSSLHRLTLEGLFGPVHQATTTKELMDNNHLAQLKIKAIVLKYPDEVRRRAKLDYPAEIEFLSMYPSRNRFIMNLALSLPGNTLILYRLVDKHGKILYDSLITQSIKKVFFIHGGIDGREREDIRGILTQEQNAILVGSYGTVSTGINIPSLHNIIFASPYKSRIKVLQSIGRGLRTTESKWQCLCFDIADDLSWKRRTNVTLKHFMERVKIYAEEGFWYKCYNVEFGINESDNF